MEFWLTPILGSTDVVEELVQGTNVYMGDMSSWTREDWQFLYRCVEMFKLVAHYRGVALGLFSNRMLY